MIDFSKLDRVIHERGRLSIMTLLAARHEWPFQELKSKLEMSDGNLITHLRALEKAGYVHSEKIPEKRQTNYGLTKQGRAAFQDYLAVLEQIIDASKS